MEHLDTLDITSFNLRISYRICSGIVTMVKTYYASSGCNAVKQARIDFPTFVSIEIIPDNYERNEVMSYEMG